MSFKKKDLNMFKKLLLAEREKVINRDSQNDDLAVQIEDLSDEHDHAAAMVQQNVNLGVKERDHRILQEILHALSKFEKGTYGYCEDTEEPIEIARLKAQPWARYCVEAAETREKTAKRFVRRAS